MKMFNYVIIGVFLSLIFEMAGISVSNEVLELIGINITTGAAAFKTSTFYIALGVLLAAGGASGIAIGYITKSSSENYVILPFIIAQVLVFGSVMIGIVSVSKGISEWVFYITLLLLSPLIVGFVIAAYEHFRGTD